MEVLHVRRRHFAVEGDREYSLVLRDRVAHLERAEGARAEGPRNERNEERTILELAPSAASRSARFSSEGPATKQRSTRADAVSPQCQPSEPASAVWCVPSQSGNTFERPHTQRFFIPAEVSHDFAAKG